MNILQNYLSDFPFVETFYQYDNSDNLVVSSIPDASIDFEFVYWAEDTRIFKAGRKGGEYYNCKPISESSIQVNIPLSRHSLGCGKLMHALHISAPNADFPEGVQRIRIPKNTGCRLHRGASSPATSSFIGTGITAAVLEGKSAYQLAVERGYEGSEEEYAMAPIRAENIANDISAILDKINGEVI